MPAIPVSRINQLASYSNGPRPIGEILAAVLAQYGLLEKDDTKDSQEFGRSNLLTLEYSRVENCALPMLSQF